MTTDGTIHLTPVWFLFEGDRFYIESSLGEQEDREPSPQTQRLDHRRRATARTGPLGVRVGNGRHPRRG